MTRVTRLRRVARAPLRCCVLVLAGIGAAGAAPLTVVDDTGTAITLQRPAQRIVALAPHVTELLFAAGAGAQVVGVVEFSDHPPAARDLPRVGNHTEFDLEGILALRPDLLVSWASGNPAPEVAALRRLGLNVFETEPVRLEDIAGLLERLGRVAGHPGAGAAAAQAFRERLSALERGAAGATPVRVFYQVWGRPLITLNGRHLVSDVLRRCGARNVFADLPDLAPRLDVEAVLDADPQVIIAGASDAESERWLAAWRAWPELAAVRDGHVFAVSATLMNRHTPRILDGMQRVCELLAAVRASPGG